MGRQPVPEFQSTSPIFKVSEKQKFGGIGACTEAPYQPWREALTCSIRKYTWPIRVDVSFCLGEGYGIFWNITLTHLRKNRD